MKDHTFKEKIDILKQSLPMLGPLMSLRYALIHLLGYSPGKDKSFDSKYGTDTTGLISSRQLAINDPTSRANAIVYLPAPEGVTRCMLEALDLNYPEFTFVDYGSGKGRILLVAAMFPFQKIVGVEISRALYDISRNNIRLYRNPRQKCFRIEVQHINALNFIPPAEPTVFHFYHPFLPEILRPVLKRIHNSLEDCPRKIYILYLYHLDFVAAVFQEAGFLRLVREVKCVNPQYSWALYTNAD